MSFSNLNLNRRNFLGAASALAVAPMALAQSVKRDFTPGANPVRYPDPDIIALDKRFEKLKIGNTPIQRLATGNLWAEGPAWNGVGNYLLWSDIPNDRQFRYLNEDNHVSVFRKPVGCSNGNTFDYQGRQISCEHLTRRVARYEYDGTVTVLADKFNGKKFNAPNDVVVHPDGGIWFTDPGYGTQGNYEGEKAPHELKEAVYRIDGKTGKITRFATPLFLALVLIEIADLVFAVDSVPAVFTITTDPYIVYTSNIFAILGLRALYFALAAMIHRFKYLKYALALVLVFIGSKIFLVGIIGKIPAMISLSVTFGLIAGGVLVSLWKTRGEQAAAEVLGFLSVFFAEVVDE